MGALPGLGIEADDAAAVGAEPDGSGVVFQDGGDVFQRRVRKGVLPVINETQPALVGAEPHDAVVVAVEALDAFAQEGRVSRPLAAEQVRDIFSRGVNQQAVVVGGNPDAPRSVGSHIFDQQTVRLPFAGGGVVGPGDLAREDDLQAGGILEQPVIRIRQVGVPRDRGLHRHGLHRDGVDADDAPVGAAEGDLVPGEDQVGRRDVGGFAFNGP